MKKEERKILEKKIHAAVLKIVKNEKLLVKDKIEKTIKKAVKQLLKKLTKKEVASAIDKAKKKSKKTVSSSSKSHALTASYKKIDITGNTKAPATSNNPTQTSS
jgi:hypothetical protein